MENKNTPYFSKDALVQFSNVQGKTIDKIICHLWQNSQNKSDVVEIIDNIVLKFKDGSKLCITCNAESDGLDVTEFDFIATKEALEKEFNGAIKIFALDASSTKMWKDVIDKKLQAIQITKENDYYKADSVLLNFGEEKRIIGINPLDGLLIDYYED